MGININYDVDPSIAGRIAYQGGRGIFEQERDKFQLDENRLAQQQGQFDARLQYDQNLALLKDRQLQDRQEFLANQGALNREAAGYDRQQGRYFDLAKMGMQNQANIAGERRADDRQISSELRGQQRLLQKNKYTKALAAAASVEDAGLKPAALEQAIGQWQEQYGKMPEFDGQFPFMSSLAANTNRPDYGEMAAGLAERLGVPLDHPSVRNLMTTDEDGNPIPISEDPVVMAEFVQKDIAYRAGIKQTQEDAANDFTIDQLKEENAATKEENTRLKAEATQTATEQRALETHFMKQLGEYSTPQKDANEVLQTPKPADAEARALKDMEALQRFRGKLKGEDDLQSSIGGIQKFNTPEEMLEAKLPSGSPFYDAKGILRTAP